MKKIPKVEGAVILTNKNMPEVTIKRCAEVLPCTEDHHPKMMGRDDILLVETDLAWCPCGRLYKRNSPQGDWKLITDMRA